MVFSSEDILMDIKVIHSVRYSVDDALEFDVEFIDNGSLIRLGYYYRASDISGSLTAPLTL